MKRGFSIAAISAMFVGVLLAGGCEKKPESATSLLFSEAERGSEPFSTRMLVTEKFLRIDYGVDDDDFILFTRADPAIYSVNRNDKTIMVIKPSKVALPPPTKFDHTVVKDDAELPQVGGKPVTRYQLLTNGSQCYEVFAASGLLPDAVQALREYHLTIAGEHASAMQSSPQDLRTDCDLANYIFVPARHLEQGFPIRQTDMFGNFRQLVDYEENQAVDSGLFSLPKDFSRYSPGEFRTL